MSLITAVKDQQKYVVYEDRIHMAVTFFSLQEAVNPYTLSQQHVA